MFKFLIGSIFFISFYIHFYPKGPDYWWCKWALLMGGLAVVISNELRKKLNISVSLAWLWASLSAIYTSSWFTNVYKDFQPETYLIIAYYSSIAFVCLLLFAYFVFYLTKERISKLSIVFALLCLFDSLFVIIQAIVGYKFIDRGGMFGNGSINGCFIAFTYPLLLDQVLGYFCKKKFLLYSLIITPIIAILLTLTSIPIGTVSLAIAVYFFFKIKGKYRYIIPGVGVLLIFTLGYLLQDGVQANRLFYSSGRFQLYYAAFTEWINRGQVLAGLGTSVYPLFGIDAQIKHKIMEGEWAVWLHSDWLQLLLENGFIGIILYINLFLTLIIKAYRQPSILAGIIAFAGTMLFNYPLHYPIHALYAVFLICAAFRNQF